MELNSCQTTAAPPTKSRRLGELDDTFMALDLAGFFSVSRFKLMLST